MQSFMRQYQNNKGRNFITACLEGSAEIPVFSQIGEGEREGIASIIAKNFFFMGSSIFKRGGSGGQLFIVHKGVVKITQPIHKNIKHPTEIKKSGHLFGQAPFIDGQKHYYTAVCVTDSVIYTINKLDFDVLALKYPTMGVKILSSIYDSLSTELNKANFLYYNLAKPV